jgi:hypothetical protein
VGVEIDKSNLTKNNGFEWQIVMVQIKGYSLMKLILILYNENKYSEFDITII